MVGIDVSKATLAVTWVNGQTHQVEWEASVPNTVDGVRQLLSATPAQLPWVLEPTGRYSLAVARQAQAAQRTVLLAQPKAAKAFLSALRPRAKTDRLDSRGLALYASATPLPPYPFKSALMDELQQLLTARKGFSGALSRLHQQAGELPAAAASLRPALTALRAQRAALDRHLAARMTQSPAWALTQELRRIPGIGPVTAATVALCVQSKAFPHPDAFVAYCGLDVRVRDSGQRRGHRTLTKQGDAELRRLLYLSAQASLRATQSPFKAQYERERAKGLSTTAALCAVARKLARLCWSLARHGTSYDPQRVYRQPTHEKALDTQP